MASVYAGPTICDNPRIYGEKNGMTVVLIGEIAITPVYTGKAPEASYRYGPRTITPAMRGGLCNF